MRRTSRSCSKAYIIISITIDITPRCTYRFTNSGFHGVWNNVYPLRKHWNLYTTNS